MYFKQFLLLIFMTVCFLPFSCGSSDNSTDGDNETVDGDEETIDGDTETADGDEDLTDGDDEATDGDDETIDGDEETIDGDVEEESAYPDHTFIYERRTPPSSLPDTTYEQEFVERYTSPDQLSSADVLKMVNIDGSIIAATSGGIFVKQADGTTFDKLTGSETIVAVDISRTLYDSKYVILATANSLIAINTEDWTFDTLTISVNEPVVAVATNTTNIYWIDLDGVHTYDNTAKGNLKSVVKTDVYPVDLEIATDGNILISTNTGVVAATPDLSENEVLWTAEENELPDNDVKDIAICRNHPDDRIVVATATGLAVHEGENVTLIKAEKGGLATDQLLSVDCNEYGILIGHAIGASFVSDDLSHKDYYVSARWLPAVTNWETDNKITAVAALVKDRYLATSKGISKIYLKERTLADKEAFFDSSYVDHFWRMDGFFSSDGYLPNSPFDSMDDMIRRDKDNDGLWTQMMIGGWCFAYAATGEEKYKNYAKKAMQNMYKLFEFPAKTFTEKGLQEGFVSRSIVREDEGSVYSDKANAGKICIKEEDDVCVEYKDALRWNPITVDDTDYYWKADTSSDEYAGHFFGWPVYYDLCADEEEKAKIAEYAGKASSYIIENDYKLMDLDGTGTLHGHWDPATISGCLDGYGACTEMGYSSEDCFDACTSGMGGGGWLNSLEIMGQLLATYHMTGDTKFYDAYEYLHTEKRYSEVAMPNDLTMTIVAPALANHSDHELAMLAYTTIIRYEPDAERRAYWIESLEFLYEYELPERNPWWAAVCALSGCETPDVESSVKTLREIPDDIREWYINNKHRKDMEIVGNDRHGDLQGDTTFPYDEIRTMWWNGNPYDLESGGDGRSIQAPTAFLLPYYMNLYSGLLTDEK